MITLYGIKNCDVMQKAFKWLDAKGIEYHFHDYRVEGLSEATITQWLQYLPLNKLLNSRSTTYRELTDKEKESAGDKAKAIKIMMEHHAIIKRPVWNLGNGKFFLGWDEKELERLLQR